MKRIVEITVEPALKPTVDPTVDPKVQQSSQRANKRKSESERAPGESKPNFEKATFLENNNYLSLKGENAEMNYYLELILERLELEKKFMSTATHLAQRLFTFYLYFFTVSMFSFASPSVCSLLLLL